MKWLWVMVGVLFATYPLGYVLQWVAELLGCYNAFEVGCAPGIGSTVGGLAWVCFIGGLFICVPLAILLSVIGGIVSIFKNKKTPSGGPVKSPKV